MLFGAANTLTGSGVTLVFTSNTGLNYGTLTAAGIFSLNLSPMTTGPTAGIAIWLDPNAPSPPIGGYSLTFATPLSVLNITGAIYAPAGSFNLVGVAAMPCTQIIASQIHLVGATVLRHNCTGVGTADVIAYKLLE